MIVRKCNTWMWPKSLRFKRAMMMYRCPVGPLINESHPQKFLFQICKHPPMDQEYLINCDRLMDENHPEKFLFQISWYLLMMCRTVQAGS